MRRGSLLTPAWTRAAFGLAAVALSACGSSEDPNGGGSGPAISDSTTQNPSAPQTQSPEEQVKEILDARKVDYGEALRTASLKLRDELPNLAEIKSIEGAPDNAAKKVAYETLVDAMLLEPKFSSVMVKFFKDLFRTGQVGPMQPGTPNKDTAANFAAQVVVEGRSWKELFTATANTCPTYDAATGAFTGASCPQGPGGGTTVGVLTNPGLQAQYFANMAFRRARFVQETFACSKFPSEYTKTPTPMGNSTYTNPRAFDDITGKKNTPAARIDFQDTSAVICGNCHGTLNVQATLFLNYDDKGLFQATPQVELPIANTPKAALSDYVPTGKQAFAWRFDKPVTDLSGFGTAMAADPEVARCAVNRVWNYAMSRGDIVNDVATVPNAVTEPYVKSFEAGGHKVKETIRAVFKSEDFVKF